MSFGRFNWPRSVGPSYKVVFEKRISRIEKKTTFSILVFQVSQINLFSDTILATFLPTGSVSWLYYSDRITEHLGFLLLQSLSLFFRI